MGSKRSVSASRPRRKPAPRKTKPKAPKPERVPVSRPPKHGMLWSLANLMGRLVAAIRALARAIMATYKLILLVYMVRRLAGRKKDGAIGALEKNLCALRITFNVDNLDVAIAYVAAVPHIVGASSRTPTRLVAYADHLVKALLALRRDVVYFKWGVML